MCTCAAARLSRMALLAQLGPWLVQQCRMIGTMYVVAQRAVLARRLVFPQEGSAFFGMAAVAVFIDREMFQ